ncbi:MAG: DUF4363 family protein [Clostridia bacterium]|nr:DUF4363 family protein [Clostridia bacterium]
MRTGAVLAVVLLAAVLAGCVAADRAIADLSVTCIGAAEELRILTEDAAWQRAGEAQAAYLARWQKATPWLQMIVHHGEITDIAMALERLGVGIDQEDASLCVLSCAELKQYAELLYRRETLSWGNLL